MASKVKSKNIRRGRGLTSLLSKKNQITVPVEVVRGMGIKPGDKLTFTLESDRIVIQRDMKKILQLAGAGAEIYKDFDLKKERESAWPQ